MVQHAGRLDHVEPRLALQLGDIGLGECDVLAQAKFADLARRIRQARQAEVHGKRARPRKAHCGQGDLLACAAAGDQDFHVLRQVSAADVRHHPRGVCASPSRVGIGFVLRAHALRNRVSNWSQGRQRLGDSRLLPNRHDLLMKHLAHGSVPATRQQSVRARQAGERAIAGKHHDLVRREVGQIRRHAVDPLCLHRILAPGVLIEVALDGQ